MDILNAEQHVLSAVLASPDLLAEIDLPATAFASETHQAIWDVMTRMFADGQPIAPLTVAQSLEATTGRDGSHWLKHLSEMLFWNPPRRIAIEAAGMIVKSHKVRSLRTIAAEIEQAATENRLEFIDAAIRKLMAIDSQDENHSHTIREGVTAALRKIEARFESRGKLPGIDTGLAQLNGILFGYMPTRLYVIGARPAMGKTAWMINQAIVAASSGFVGIISGEQDVSEICERMIAINGRIAGDSLQTGNLTESEWPCLTASISQLSKLPISIFDRPGVTILELVRQAREWKYRHNLACLFVDYLQLVRGSNARESRIDQVGEVSRSLKNLAKELKIPIVTLAMINRECEKRVDKRPGVSDLANSGEIERDADVIITLYRDEVYNPESPSRGIAEIAVLKNRHGATGVCRVQYSPREMRFNNLAERGEWR